MTFFNVSEPVLRRKQSALDVQDLCGLLKVHFKLGSVPLLSSAYTRVDQAILLWGVIVWVIFGAAQFLMIDWTIQAYLWSGLTLLGTVAMISLTQFWARVEQLSWVVYSWGGLMLSGLLLTDIGIFGHWGLVLMHLCSMWLGLSAIGYLMTAIGVRSRMLLLLGLAHLAAMLLVTLLPAWQFLLTGAVMGSSLILLSEWQWDMRLPSEFVCLTVEEQQFNQSQRSVRQRSGL